MIAFFIILAVLMVLVVAVGAGWGRAPRRYGRDVIVDRDPEVIVDRGPEVIVDRGSEVVEEEVIEEPAPRPAAPTRRVVRRRRF